MKLKLPCILGVLEVALLGAGPLGQAQPIGDFYRITDSVSRNRMEYHQLEVPRGKEAVLADLKGPGKVTYFYITDATQVHWYPGLVLRVFWDGETEPSVQAPLADFFGAIGGKTIDYQSAPMQINHACYMCYLPMPFSERARFILANDGKAMTHTPGTEDEYGSCWGFEHTYSYLYSGCLQMEKGDNRMYRWYVANPVRFRQSLKVQIQNQHNNGKPATSDADDYTSVAFWYQEEPHQTLRQRSGIGAFGTGSRQGRRSVFDGS